VILELLDVAASLLPEVNLDAARVEHGQFHDSKAPH
jgi:hypothetical protein